MNRIMIATDGSEGGLAAVETGAELARSSGATATLVYVRDAEAPALTDAYSRRSLSLEQQRAERSVAESATRLADSGVAVETAVLAGDPAGKILELAREQRSDLVVVGSRGNGTIAEVLLGRVSGPLVRRADRPVLVATPRRPRARCAA
jgi:nucleotide-binding universal stress UspA family protein